MHDFDFSGSHSIAVALNLAGAWSAAEWLRRKGREGRELALRKRLWVNPSGMNSFGIHEKAAERKVYQRRFFMSRLPFVRHTG
jgi:hypothetical protein